MSLQLRNINKGYYNTTQANDRKCSVCRFDFDETPSDTWVAHENPKMKYRVVTRRFSTYIHPMHKDCFERLQPRPGDVYVKCPECRLFVGPPHQLPPEPEPVRAPLAPRVQTIQPPPQPDHHDASLSAFGSAIASLVTGAGFIQATLVGTATFFSAKILAHLNPRLGNFAPIASICIAAILGTLSSVEYTVRSVFLATLGAIIGSEAVNTPIEALIKQNLNDVFIIPTLGICLGVFRLSKKMMHMSQATQIFLTAALGGIAATGMTKFVDMVARK